MPASIIPITSTGRYCRSRSAPRWPKISTKADAERGHLARNAGGAPAVHRDLTSTPVDPCEALEQLAEERRLALGEDHPETLTAMLDLADCLWAQGRLIAARKLEEQVVEGRRRVLGEQHPDTLKALGKLAVSLGAQGNLAEAQRLQEQVVSGRRALFGDTDLETLRAVNNLAGTLAALGDFARARELLEFVVASTSSQFGEQHAESLTAMSNLAAVLWQGGEREEAYALQQQVVELARGAPGVNPDAARNAAAVLESMEQDPEI